MSALTGSSRKHHLPMTWYLREVEKTWRAHQTLLQPSKLSPFWKRRSSWCSWQAQSFHAHLGHCASATLKNTSLSGRSFGEAPNKIVFPPGDPNYTSVVLLTSWIKERCLSCCSSLTDPQGQPKSTSWLDGPTSISSWLHDFLLQTDGFPPLLLSDILSTTFPGFSGL